jgi:hypothetical protein
MQRTDNPTGKATLIGRLIASDRTLGDLEQDRLFYSQGQKMSFFPSSLARDGTCVLCLPPYKHHEDVFV